MNNVQKQCQTQLELERVVITARLQQPTSPDEVSALDAVDWQLLQQMRVKLQNIEHALKRLTDGQFGLCQECQRPIDAGRLLALPTCGLCIDCQRRLERVTIQRHRPRQLSSATLG